MTDLPTGEIRVIGAIADKDKVVLYTEDGKDYTIRQGDYRLKHLIDAVLPITAKGQVAVVSLETYSVWTDYQKKTNGLVKFFKVIRNKLGSFLGQDKATEVAVVNVEVTPDPEPSKPDEPAKEEPALMAIDMVVENKDGKVTTETVLERIEPFKNDEEVKSDETILAVMGNLVIPDADKLKPYILHASKHNSVEGIQNFIQRCGNVMKSRGHSIVDLMRFLEKGDLPIADDGSIIAYKILRKSGYKDDLFVDCHTKKVTQKVGSYVCVDEKLVDRNRHTECSNGLHIARRGYLGQFDGDVCVLCKIAPEDVMVVPHADPNKIRVKGYHILELLSDESMKILKTNRPMTEQEDALLAVRNAIHGKHVGRLEEVKIHGQKGENVVITPLGKPKLREVKEIESTRGSYDRAAAFDDPNNKGQIIEPSELNKRVNEELKALEGGATELHSDTTAEPTKEADSPPVKQQKEKGKTVKEPSSKKGSKKETKPKKLKEPKVQKAEKPKRPNSGNANELTEEQKRALALLKSGISQSETSRQTGIPRRTLDRWLKKYGDQV